MARYLLDTNILVFLVSGQIDNISRDTKSILDDYNSELFTSAIAMTELVQLYRINKIQQKKMFKNSLEMILAIEKDFLIRILPFTKEHLKTLSKLRVKQNHNDPFDHSIIAHAITEKLTLISSDRQFDHYTKQNLDFVFNKRS